MDTLGDPADALARLLEDAAPMRFPAGWVRLDKRAAYRLCDDIGTGRRPAAMAEVAAEIREVIRDAYPIPLTDQVRLSAGQAAALALALRAPGDHSGSLHLARVPRSLSREGVVRQLALTLLLAPAVTAGLWAAVMAAIVGQRRDSQLAGWAVVPILLTALLAAGRADAYGLGSGPRIAWASTAGLLSLPFLVLMWNVLVST
jgi:hypothetical protein